MHINNELKIEKQLIFIKSDFLFNKRKRNNIKDSNRSTYKYFFVKKLISIFKVYNIFLKRLFMKYF